MKSKTGRKHFKEVAPWMQKVNRYIKEHHGTQKSFVKVANISAPYLCDLLQGKDVPSWNSIMAICDASCGKIKPNDIITPYLKHAYGKKVS